MPETPPPSQTAILMDLVQRSTSYLTARGIANGRRETEWIFSETLKLSRLELYTRFDMPLSMDEVDRLRKLVQRRGNREPLAYVLGNQDFYGLRLRIGPGVLVPRPETEELVELVLASLSPDAAAVLDVGTGSGAIALAIKQARPGLRVDATDLSPDALAYARGNAAAVGLEVHCFQGHLAQELAGGYDVVVANLPYIAQDEWAACDPELTFEPRDALVAGGDGLALIAELIADAGRLLVPKGLLWLEHGYQQGAAVRSLAEEHGLRVLSLQDRSGQPRFARCDREPVSGS